MTQTSTLNWAFVEANVAAVFTETGLQRSPRLFRGWLSAAPLVRAGTWIIFMYRLIGTPKRSGRHASQCRCGRRRRGANVFAGQLDWPG